MQVRSKELRRRVDACSRGVTVGPKETMVVGNIEEIGIKASDGCMRLPCTARSDDEDASVGAPDGRRVNVEIAECACPPVD